MNKKGKGKGGGRDHSSGTSVANRRRGQIFCPNQKGTEGPGGIPITEYHYHGGTRAYRKMMKRRWRRAKRIASALIGRYQIPVTPLPDPVTNRSSCHIVRLIDKSKPKYCVDLLFKDINAYLVAFRRCRLGDDGKWNGNRWYRYSDVKDLPPEIQKNAVSLGFRSSHGNGNTPGGLATLQDMFEVLKSCEDRECDPDTKMLVKDYDRERVRIALLKAIVMFSEAFRFRCLYLSMLERIKDGADSSFVDPDSWILIHNWSQSSGEVLALWQDELPPLHTKAPDWFKKLKVRRPHSDKYVALDDIIGEEGELLLLKAVHGKIVSPDEYKILAETRLPVPEPGFC